MQTPQQRNLGQQRRALPAALQDRQRRQRDGHHRRRRPVCGADITYKIHDSESVYVTLDGKPEPFEFFFDIKALRDFLMRGGEALAEMAALAVHEAEQDAGTQHEAAGCST